MSLLFLVTRVTDEVEDDYDESAEDVVDNIAIGNHRLLDCFIKPWSHVK